MKNNQKITFNLLDGDQVLFDLEEISKSRSTMPKSKFFDLVGRLEYLSDMGEEAVEFGIDLSVYEAPFYEMIEELLLLYFTNSQLDLIFFYVNEVRHLPRDKRASVKTSISKNGGIFKLRTKEDLWKAVNTLTDAR